MDNTDIISKLNKNIDDAILKVDKNKKEISDYKDKIAKDKEEIKELKEHIEVCKLASKILSKNIENSKLFSVDYNKKTGMLNLSINLSENQEEVSKKINQKKDKKNNEELVQESDKDTINVKKSDLYEEPKKVSGLTSLNFFIYKDKQYDGYKDCCNKNNIYFDDFVTFINLHQNLINKTPEEQIDAYIHSSDKFRIYEGKLYHSIEKCCMAAGVTVKDYNKYKNKNLNATPGDYKRYIIHQAEADKKLKQGKENLVEEKKNLKEKKDTPVKTRTKRKLYSDIPETKTQPKELFRITTATPVSYNGIQYSSYKVLSEKRRLPMSQFYNFMMANGEKYCIKKDDGYDMTKLVNEYVMTHRTRGRSDKSLLQYDPDREEIRSIYKKGFDDFYKMNDIDMIDRIDNDYEGYGYN